ncbi:DDE-type integrase/transposase/recombinase [Rhodocytophaga rosea]|uniref:DDE-type integrase/transposase/recombinase n=1 Tax=Rhodocytophaga rosea TaxID=2704465 RepID=A0A6C0GU48_9BACT|nr:DDE-type integrase/transposase/recombinase [Rhodocytophaga rosea]
MCSIGSTYVWTREGWLFLAVVLDLFSRKLVGWAMNQNMETGLVVSALQMALLARSPQKGLLHHSDRGSQYASNDYQKLLKDNKMICSMSRKGNGPQMLMMGRSIMIMPVWRAFLLRLNRNWSTIASTRPARKPEKISLNTFRYGTIENTIEPGGEDCARREHSKLGYLSPEQFETKGQYQIAA